MGSGLFQPMHILVILIIALLIWGPGRLSNLGHDLGKSIRDFKKALTDSDSTPTDVSTRAKEETARKDQA